MHGFVYGPLFDAHGSVATAQLGFLFSRGVPVRDLSPRLRGIGRLAQISFIRLRTLVNKSPSS
jgi:hypothetical protein